ncbi:MAG: sulfatase-like hydrolase/transferase [Bryobacterales bacterium]|nr:sulfatase-like hydrolase/transferase [Bryobacterales bacterium]
MDHTIPHLSRRGFVAGAAAQAVKGQPQASRKAPNILYIMTDQQHAGMMSCTGNRWLKTPAMDSLAKAGTRFELAYSSNPVCMPARTSMMTGRYPSHFGIRGNQGRPIPPEEQAHALGNLLRGSGYRTVFGGKTHWPSSMTPESIGFEYLTADERDELADKCAGFLRERHESPFLLVASFINPHDICYMAIDAYTRAENLPAMYPKNQTERKCVAAASALPPGVSRQEFFASHCPPLPPNHGATEGEPGAYGQYGSFRGWARRNWSAEDWRLHRWAYCRLTESVDSQIGRVLEALRATGLDRTTVVIFSSDHGDMDASHGFEHKSLPYEESARVPFIVSWPGHIPAGAIDRRHLVSSCVDLLPTICDYAGVQAPNGLPGRSIKPVASGGTVSDWRRELVIECSGGRCLRTRRYKYTVWEGPVPREMLIDMEKDPGEMTNLAAKPAFASVLADHRRLLRQHIESREDNYGRSLLSTA